MKYWDEMLTKYGFGDGSAMPDRIQRFRTAYILAVNAMAKHLNSSYRAFAFDRNGLHNWCLVRFTSDPEALAAKPGQLVIPQWCIAAETPDSQMADAISQVRELDIDCYVSVRVSIQMAQLVKLLAAIKRGA